MRLSEKLDEVLVVMGAFDTWACTGDAMRCADGNGCECALVGKDCPPVFDAMNALLRDHGEELRQALKDSERYRWLRSLDGASDAAAAVMLNIGFDWREVHGEALDAAIDAAMTTPEDAE